MFYDHLCCLTYSAISSILPTATLKNWTSRVHFPFVTFDTPGKSVVIEAVTSECSYGMSSSMWIRYRIERGLKCRSLRNTIIHNKYLMLYQHHHNHRRHVTFRFPGQLFSSTSLTQSFGNEFYDTEKLTKWKHDIFFARITAGHILTEVDLPESRLAKTQWNYQRVIVVGARGRE